MTATTDRRLVGTTTAERLAGCTRRQLDSWIRHSLLIPTVQAQGSGSRRQFGLRDILQLRAIRRVAIVFGGSNLEGSWSLSDAATIIGAATSRALATGFSFGVEHITISVDLAIDAEHEPELAEWVAAELPGIDR